MCREFALSARKNRYFVSDPGDGIGVQLIEIYQKTEARNENSLLASVRFPVFLLRYYSAYSFGPCSSFGSKSGQPSSIALSGIHFGYISQVSRPRYFLHSLHLPVLLLGIKLSSAILQHLFWLEVWAAPSGQHFVWNPLRVLWTRCCKIHPLSALVTLHRHGLQGHSPHHLLVADQRHLFHHAFLLRRQLLHVLSPPSCK